MEKVINMDMTPKLDMTPKKRRVIYDLVEPVPKLDMSRKMDVVTRLILEMKKEDAELKKLLDDNRKLDAMERMSKYKFRMFKRNM